MNRLLMVMAGAALVVGTVELAQAATITVPVSEDESVYLLESDPYRNLDDSSYRGGLFSGVDGGSTDSLAQFYLKFNLPSYVAKTQVTSAVLTGYYNDDYNRADDGTHGIYLVPGYGVGWYDDWSESTISWYGQPFNYQYFRDYELIANFDAAKATVGTRISWDITQAVNQEYQGDGVLSLLVRPDDDLLTSTNQNWEYFVEKEYDSTKAFRVEMETAPIPEPSTTAGSLLFGALGVIYWLKHRLRHQ